VGDRDRAGEGGQSRDGLDARHARYQGARVVSGRALPRSHRPGGAFERAHHHRGLRADRLAVLSEERDAMKKIINRVDDFLSESLAGFASAHGDVVTLNKEPVFVRRRELTTGKVALIS